MESMSLKDFLKTHKVDIVLLVATDTELEVVLEHLTPLSEEDSIYKIYHGSLTYYCGTFGKYSTAVLKTNKMGSSQRGASIQVTTTLIGDLNPKILIMPGIAFGKDSNKQKIGDILVSTSLGIYEPSRISFDNSISYRGPIPEANEILINRFSSEKSFSFIYEDVEKEVNIHTGLLLSGEKLIDNTDFKSSLCENFPNVIGGEMEGAGVYASSDFKKLPWILIKSICDWGDGNKNKEHQKFAATSSVKYILKKCSENLIFEALQVSPYETQENTKEIRIDASDILSKLVSPRDYQDTIKSLQSSIMQTKKNLDPNRSSKRIHYEYYTHSENGTITGFLFLGKHITVKNVFEEFVHLYDKPDFLEIYLTKKYNKSTDKLIDRKKTINEKITDHKLKTIVREKIFYIDELIWEISNFQHLETKNKDKIYIDQQLYSFDLYSEQDYLQKERSVDFFKNRIHEEHSPVSVIFGSGGVGKSTFCKSIEDTFNEQFPNKKVFLIKGERIEFCQFENVTINSLEDLFNLYKNEAGFSTMSSEDFKLNFICGNIIVVIDALDEIEATLDTQINLSNFFQSLAQLEERFYSTKVILTTREQFKEKLKDIDKSLKIKYYTIKGFSSSDIEDYLRRKYQNNTTQKQIISDFLLKHKLQKGNFIIPLFVHWACTILNDNANLELVDSKSTFFLPNNKIDQLFMELVNREKEKKGLQHIEIDDFFHLLFFVVFDFHGQLPKNAFYEYCQDLDIDTTNAKKIELMTMFESSASHITIKYDILHNIVKSRYINAAMHNNYPMSDYLIKLFKEMYLGKNELFEDLLDTLSICENKLLSTVTHMIKGLKECFLNNTTHGSNSKITIKKAFSGLLYLLISKTESITTIKERTNLLKNAYSDDFSYLFIYGDFYSLDFSNISIKHSLFDSFEQFNKCEFPNIDGVVFSDTEFRNIHCHKKLSLNNTHFKNCYFTNTNIKDLVDEKTEKIDNKKKTIRKDLRAITRFIDDSQKSLNYIKMHSGVTYSRGHARYVNILVENNYLEEIIHNANKEYRIHPNFRQYIEDIKLGSFNCKETQQIVEQLTKEL